MQSNNKRAHWEGIIIIAIGIFFTMLALTVPKNPVELQGWLNIVAQARTVPLLAGILLTVFGIMFTLDLKAGRVKSSEAGIKDRKNAVIKVAINIIYLISIIYFGFKIPTAIYLIVIITYLNKDRSKPYTIAGVIVLFYIVSIIIMPKLLNLRLP